MADKKISELSEVLLPLNDNDTFVVVQSGTTKKISSLDLLSTTSSQIENISNLRSYSSALSDKKTINVLGYYNAGDGGGGQFYWDATSTETDNGGTIIKITSATTGRFKRDLKDYIDAKWFGVSNGIDSTSNLQKAIDYCKNNPIKEIKCIGFSDLRYNQIDVNAIDNLKLNFTGSKSTLTSSSSLAIAGSGTASIRLINSKNCEVTGLECDGNGFSSGIIGIESCENTHINKNHFYGQNGRGIVSVASTKTVISYNEVHDNLISNGIIVGNNNTGFADTESVIEHNKVYNCAATGIVFQSIGGNASFNKSYSNAGSGIIPTGYYPEESAEKVVINGNECYLNDFSGIQEDTYLDLSASSNEIIVVNNICYNNGFNGIVNFRHDNWVISNNVCYDNGFAGFTSAGIRIEGGNNMIISNNICYNKNTANQKTGISILSEILDITNVSVLGNICYNNLDDGILCSLVSASTTIENIIIRNNNCNNNKYGLFITSYDSENTFSGSVTNNLCYDNTTKDCRVSPKKLEYKNNLYNTDNDNGYTQLIDKGATPYVYTRSVFRIRNNSAQTITNFLGAYDGQVIHCFFTDANTTLSSGFVFKDGTASKSMTVNTGITLLRALGRWTEI